ncbi:glycine--tRNA ligase subunit beta [Sphingomonas sp. SM33]|uniref:Glycine--tRNA ligase beta subunit n=2 Tax=Sphingomonas telluris TaxID=2907998 RepID=A0ABS9VJD0_9SPHN|nr:glycine--tRNA ligase subunit beta [Sphingomonas telluris]
MQAGARNDLARLLAEELEELGVAAEAIDVWSTPRRLALVARGLPVETQAVSEEIKGPRTSAPPQALEGFLRKVGLPHEQLQERDGVWFAIVEKPGRPMRDLLGPIVERIIRGFPWPKSMRWGASSESTASLRWVRPLHGIVALLGEEIVPIQIDGITSGATTVGHRFHHPGPITVGGAHDYAEKLRACHVIVDHEEREKLVREGAAKAATDAGLELVADEGLVVENAGLTEWPVPLLGRFDADYLDVPREVIVLTMRTNQKYFACTDAEGLLAPAFICTANIDANDGGQAIVEGNRRVLAARLSDARFFWEQDLKVPLDEQTAKLGGIVFHEKLGTVADKVARVAKLAQWLVKERLVPGADPDQVRIAAKMAKSDLVTQIVGEFPELQGTLGGYIARAQGEPNAVADALRDHYRPAGQGDDVPTDPVTVAVNIADRLDTLVAFFSIGEKPTGSRDPFALRRAALGFLQILTRNGLRMPLSDVLVEAAVLLIVSRLGAINTVTFPDLLEPDEDEHEITAEVGSFTYRHGDRVVVRWDSSKTPKIERGQIIEEATSISEQILDFLEDRLKVQQRDAGVRHDLIDAVFALGDEDDIVRLLARVKALQAFIGTKDGADLLTGYKRAANILRKEKWEERRDPRSHSYEPLHQEAELDEALDAAEPRAEQAIEEEDFERAMKVLASLRAPVDAFFDHVTVNDPDPEKRERRLNLLARLRDAVNRVADFSKIEG